MHQGIFTVLPDFTVHPEHSAYLEKILETNEIAGRDAMDLLFAKTNLSANTLDQVRAALSSIVGEDEMMFDFNKHLLVRDVTRTLPDGRKKILELEWDPIRSDAGTVEKLMVTVRDVTELKRLQAEAQHQKWELEVIGQILALSKSKFQAFLKNALEFVDANEAVLVKDEPLSVESVALLFRHMHTVKGNARTYGLTAISEAAHVAEHTYDKWRKTAIQDWSAAKYQALDELNEVRELLYTYERIYKTKLASNDGDGLFLDMELVQIGKRTLAEIDEHDPESLRQGLTRIQNLVHAIGTETIPSVLEGIVKALPEMASKMGKEAPQVVVKDNSIRLSAEIAPVLKNVLTHEFRNSLDHGIEVPGEREASGKPKQGTITLEATEDKGRLLIRLYDDGRGLALDKIRQRAIEKGLVAADAKLSDHDIAQLIFASGLTTSEGVSDISGRGVGMDAIKSFVAGIGGDVILKLQDKTGSHGCYRRFESHISLPKNSYIKVA
jgi:two-component system chemotaxis sensor kinase CheA